jgi:hypothetical protein
MTRAIAVGLAIGAMALLVPDQAEAQTGADGWWDWAAAAVYGGQQVPTRRGNVTIPEARGQARGAAQGQGPPFCRSGEGHPVHGRRWCAEHGWPLGSEGIWRRGSWEDVIFRSPRDRRQGNLDRGGLVETLGQVVFGRVDDHRRRLGASEPLVGRWHVDGSGARVLQLRAGNRPVAEFTDLNGDGRADLVLIAGN